jgi:hypothetical protein
MSAVENMLRRFSVQFGPPNTPDDDAFIGEFRRSLAFYEQRPEILDKVASEIIDTSEQPFWPAVGKVRKNAERIAAELHAKQVIGSHVPRQTIAEPIPPRDADSHARCDALVRELKAFVAAHALKPPKQAPLADVSRPAFERMQTSHSGLHRELTPRSRAMAGEAD